jgi:hypothetical protein
VRLIAAADAPPPRTFTWRRVLVVALPVAAAVAAAIVFTRPSHQQRVVHGEARVPALPAQTGAATKSFAAPAVPAPPLGRVVQYDATLSLRVPRPNDVSNAVKRALRVASSLGGYPTSVHATTQAKTGAADLTLKIPRQHVQEAVTRLSALGTITGEQVDLQDLQAGINATQREIARLQRQLAVLRTQHPTSATKRRIAALTAQIASLQRGAADTRRTAHYATVSLHLATPQHAVHRTHHGPLHGLGVALTWLGIAAVYGLVLGLPVVLVVVLGWLVVRAIHRRRENELLSRP